MGSYGDKYIYVNLDAMLENLPSPHHEPLEFNIAKRKEKPPFALGVTLSLSIIMAESLDQFSGIDLSLSKSPRPK